LFFEENPDPDSLAEWIINVILKPATKLQEASHTQDKDWTKFEAMDQAKMKTYQAVVTRVIDIYNLYGFYVKPTKAIKLSCPTLYEWLSSKRITKVHSLKFNGTHDNACTNIPIVFSVISLMIQKKNLVWSTHCWSSAFKKRATLKHEG
jgi:hypothetical protein